MNTDFDMYIQVLVYVETSKSVNICGVIDGKVHVSLGMNCIPISTCIYGNLLIHGQRVIWNISALFMPLQYKV